MAIQTFKNTMTWTGKGLSVKGGTRGFDVTMDEPKELGGTNTGMNPVEMLLSSLGGCITICAAAFAGKCKVDLKGVSVDLEGDLDPAGFLGLVPNTKKGFQQIRFKLNIDSPSPQANIDKLIALIDERCPVSDTLKGVEVIASA